METRATPGAGCFICLDDSAQKPFLNGAFCPNEGKQVFVALHLVQDHVQLQVTGKHGPLHQECLDRALSMANACPMCRLPLIKSSNALARLLIAPNQFSAGQTSLAYAQDPESPRELLTALARVANIVVRESVALNPSVPLETLQSLALDEDDQVRIAVAENNTTPAAILTDLASDPQASVREAVAENTNTAFHTLETLALDQHAFIRRSVAINLNTPQLVLAGLSKDECERVREDVALNPNTALEVVAILVNDSSSIVSLAAQARQMTLEI